MSLQTSSCARPRSKLTLPGPPGQAGTCSDVRDRPAISGLFMSLRLCCGQTRARFLLAMFFYLSKIIGFFASPTHLAICLMLAGAVLGFGRLARAGRGLGLAGLLLLVAVAATPLPRLLARPLEDRFPVPAMSDPRPVAGIIVLGGAIGESRGQMTFTGAAARMTEAVMLARRQPQARLVFTGGSGALLSRNAPSEASVAGRFFAEMGLAADRITLEDKSRNTDENARFTARLVAPKPGERWLLVTSALHMPRSMAVFRAAGLDLEPWPVDYRTSGQRRDFLSPGRIWATNLELADDAMREWVGLAAYRLAGKTQQLLP